MYTQAKFKVGSYLLIFLLLPLLTNAQSRGWPKGEARWMFIYFSDPGAIPNRLYAHQYGDTIINDKLYHFIIDDPVDYGDSYPAYIRSEGDKVYLWPKDSTEEFVIYDYSLKVGDTFETKGWTIGLGINKIPIKWISEEIIHGIKRKFISVGDEDSDTWIEGIGNYWSATKIAGFITLSGWSKLECCTHNDTLVYGNESYCRQYLPVSVSETQNDYETIVYPNPTDAILHLEFPESTIKRMYLINVIGELDPLPIQRTLDLSKYPPGTYYLHINTSQGNIVREIIIQR